MAVARTRKTRFVTATPLLLVHASLFAIAINRSAAWRGAVRRYYRQQESESQNVNVQKDRRNTLTTVRAARHTRAKLDGIFSRSHASSGDRCEQPATQLHQVEACTTRRRRRRRARIAQEDFVFTLYIISPKSKNGEDCCCCMITADIFTFLSLSSEKRGDYSDFPIDRRCSHIQMLRSRTHKRTIGRSVYPQNFLRSVTGSRLIDHLSHCAQNLHCLLLCSTDLGDLH